MKQETTLLLYVVLALVLIGVVVVYSANAVGPASAPTLSVSGVLSLLGRQGVFALGGLYVMYCAARFDYHRFRHPAVLRILLIVTVACLFAVLVPGVGVVVKGARRWIGVAGFTFQPSELAKLALIVILAVKLAENQEKIRTFRWGFFPHIVIVCLFAGLVLLERDLGTPVVLGMVGMVMMIMAGVRWNYAVSAGIVAAPVLSALVVTEEYRLRRFTAFMDPWRYSDDESFQLIQSMAAFTQGSLWGRGPGASQQKLHYLPEASSDFIFAVWGEETGFVGSIIVVALFVVLVILAMRIAVCAPDLLGALLAAGIGALVGIQAAFNMAVSIGLLPTKGLPLPFISSGGSSLLVMLALMGILINVGLQAEEPSVHRRPASARR
jgi:cell division protein FtsW